MNNRDIKNRVGGGPAGGLFHNISSIANLFSVWSEFRKGKRKKRDVAIFEMHLEDNLFRLHEELGSGVFKLDPYQSFSVSDPKPRKIHKATVRDRVLNQAVFRVLYPVFDKSFIFDSFSSRKRKGVHAGVARLFSASGKATANWKKPGYVLKSDVAKFFDSIDHAILFSLLKRRIKDSKTLELLRIIIGSFEKSPGLGLPLGNVTSQLFANIYLNELDRFIKHTLKAGYYFRYADDFIILHSDRNMLLEYEESVREFLWENLRLKLHKNKVLVRKISQGVDFLGYVVLPHALVLRTKTKNRILRKIMLEEAIDEKFFRRLDSYLGILKHCKSRSIKKEIFDYLLD
jgi:RNA-directed DNA polymerase